MRQIDNYTDEQLNDLDVKGMTAPRTASERPAPNKAQHSPIVDVESVLRVATALQKVAELPPESNRDKLTATLTESRQKLLELRERDAREYATLKAHAYKLAEAIVKIRTALDRGLDLTPSIYGAIAALAAYEEAK